MFDGLCLLVLPLGLVIAVVVLLAIALAKLSDLGKSVKDLKSELYRIARFQLPMARDARADAAPTQPDKPAEPVAPQEPPRQWVVDDTSAEAVTPSAPQTGPTEPASEQPDARVTERREAVDRMFSGLVPAAIEAAAEEPGQPILELFVGRKLMAWVGMLALLVSSVLFIIYAHNHHWLSNELKTAIYVAVGLALIGLGEWASRRQWTPLARTLSGGGIAELMFAAFSAMALYDLIGWTTFLVCIGLVVALGILLALRYDSLTISLITTLSGMIAPLMLWEVSPDFGVVFAFVAAVDISVLIVAGLRRWRVTSVVAFVGTAVNVATWLWREHAFQLTSTAFPGGVRADFAIGVLAGFFALFLVASIIKYLVRRDVQIDDIAVYILNPLCAYAATYVLFSARYADPMAAVAAALGVLYLTLTGLSHWRLTTRHPLYSLSVLYGVGFLVLSVSMYYDGLVIPTMLAVMAVALFVAAEASRSWQLQWAGLAVYICTAIALVANRPEIMGTHDRVIFNARTMTLTVCIASLALAAILVRRTRIKHINALDRQCAPVVALIAHALALMLFTIEVRNYFDTAANVAQGHLARQMVYSIGYALYATGMLVAGFIARRAYLRLSALVLFAVTLAKIAVYDVVELRELYRIASVFGLAVLLLAGAWLYNKYQHLLLPKSETPEGSPGAESSKISPQE